METGSALYHRPAGGLASWFEVAPPILKTHRISVNRTSLGTPVCCCCTKMCSKTGTSLSLSLNKKTKFYRALSLNQGKRTFPNTLSIVSAMHALIYKPESTTCFGAVCQWPLNRHNPWTRSSQNIWSTFLVLQTPPRILVQLTLV